MDPSLFSLILLLTAGFAFFAFFLRLFRRMSHFDRLGVLYERPLPILGNMSVCLFRQVFIGEHLIRLYQKFSHVKYFGFFDFWTPVVIVRDPKLITAIAIKHFDNFCDHRGFADRDVDPLFGGNLFSLRGDEWREMRRLLSPAFTTSKMKTMHGLICECADTFVGHLFEDSVRHGGTHRDVDAKELICRYTNDVVASTAFGVKVDSMQDRNNDFYRLGRKALSFDAGLSLKFLLATKFRWFMKLFDIKLFSEEVRRFFENLVESQVRARVEGGIRRPDMIQLMMERRETSEGVAKKLSVAEMTAQAFVFFFAGFEATASGICFMLHEIALNPDVQERLRREIRATLERADGGTPTYDAINRMRYLDAVVTEVNRMYPLPAFLDRLCVKEFELPPATHSPDGSEKPVKLRPGDVIWFPVYPIHRDPVYYPDPDKFDPGRFLDRQPDPNVHLTFGLGPRLCIGNRFALMESKILIFYLLARCALEPATKTTIPMEYCTNNLQIRPKTGFWIRLRNLENPLLPLPTTADSAQRQTPS